MRRALVTCVLLAVAGRAAVADPALALDLPEPTAPEPQVIREPTPSPLYYRLPPDGSLPLVRSALGVGLRGTRTDSQPDGTAFMLDAFYGRALTFRRQSHFGMNVEGGYSYSRFHDHLFVLGAGPALRHVGPTVFGQGAISVALVPHVVLGSSDGTGAHGVRTSLVASFWLYGLEVAHQYVVAGDHHVQEVQVLLTFPLVLGDGQ